jgi:transcription antitermination factor NusG
MNESKNWYAVYTRPRWEKKVAGILTRNNIENYCPLNKVRRQWSDRKKFVLEPLFTSYVFVKVSEFEHSRLKETDGVINMVYWLGKPAVIREVEIDMIKNFLSECINVKLEKRPIYINDKVRVIGGPLTELEGQVIGLKTRTVKIMLPSLGYMMLAEVETGNVKIIEPGGVSQQYEIQTERYAYK